MNNLSISDLISVYKSIDILYFASTYEGFGMPIIEANAVGRPVITSNVYSMPEVAGNAACLVDPLNINDIKNGILRILDDKIYRDKLVLNGFINAKRFDASTIAEQYAKIYREMD
jgi:glycosyltransferase involved in cell wall biosynthesis